MSHGLLSTVRRVPASQRARHAQLWERIRAAVEAAGGRAWAFYRTDDPEVVIEFIEGRGLDALLDDTHVAEALKSMESTTPHERSERWESMAEDA